jgi:outer membrane protein assembly factor BamB
MVGLPLAWSAAVSRWTLYGVFARPGWSIVAVLTAVALAAFAKWLPPPARWWPIGIAVALGCVVHAVAWFWQIAELSEVGTVIPYFLTTAWTGGLCTLGQGELRVPARGRLLASALGFVLLGGALLDCRGTDGDGRPIVCWNFSRLGFDRVVGWDKGVKRAPAHRPERQGDKGTRGQGECVRSSWHDCSRHDFPAFRGEGGQGQVEGVSLAREWAASCPRLLWRQAIGKGWGGFAIVGPRVYTQEQRGADECVVSYEAATGREWWVHYDRACFASPTAGDGPRATPSVFGGAVFTLGATGLLNCLDAETGERRWSVDVLADNQAGNLYHGLSGSPLVVGNLVVVSVGRKGRSLAAYDVHSGRRVWQAGSDPAGYGSPLLCTLGGREQVVILNRPGLAAHDPLTGEVLWTFPWANGEETNCSQPARVADDRLLVSTGYGKGSALLQVCQQAGEWLVEPLWTSRRLKTKFSSAVVRRGHAFGLDDGILACVSLADGSLRWRAGRYGHGQVLFVDDVLLIQCEDGDLAMVAADPARHCELARCRALHEKTWNYPALAGRLLLLRNDCEAACFELPVN